MCISRIRAASWAATFATIFLSSTSYANYVGLSVVHHATVNIGGTDRTVWRVYANFTNPLDRLLVLYGSPTLGPMSIQSRNSNDTGIGSNFANPGGAGDLAPTAAATAMNPNVEWDSFYTVGVSIADQAPYGNQTIFAPGMPALTGNSIATSNSGWLAESEFDHDNNPGTPVIPSPQTQAGFLGDGDPLLRVLCLQLTVNAGDNVRGTLNVAFRLAGVDGESIAQQTFNSVPGPGGLMVVLAAFLRNRRRTAFQSS